MKHLPITTRFALVALGTLASACTFALALAPIVA